MPPTLRPFRRVLVPPLSPTTMGHFKAKAPRRVQPLNYAGWCLDLMVTPFTGLDEKLEAKREDDALSNGACSVCP
jgi:hypothetical protein